MMQEMSLKMDGMNLKAYLVENKWKDLLKEQHLHKAHI